MVDFNINLAKTMTSTLEERTRFYNRMLIYLVICAAALVGISYLASRNVMQALSDNKEREQLVEGMAAASIYGKTFFDDPRQAFSEFKSYATDLETLRDMLSERSQFLPVLSQLFSDIPDHVVLEELVASGMDKSIEFTLVTPIVDENGQQVLPALQARWRENEQLHTFANAVTLVTSEREMVGEILMAHAQYKCILK